MDSLKGWARKMLYGLEMSVLTAGRIEVGAYSLRSDTYSLTEGQRPSPRSHSRPDESCLT